MIGTSDGKQYNSEFDFMLGNEIPTETKANVLSQGNKRTSDAPKGSEGPSTETAGMYPINKAVKDIYNTIPPNWKDNAIENGRQVIEGYKNNIKRESVIIRHGDTSYTENDKAHGWSKEPLTENGVKEVERFADLKNKPDILVASDLPRTSQTADIVSKKNSIPIAETTPGLRTWNIGELQGKPCTQVDKQLEKYVSNPDKPIPGGESFNNFKTRVLGSVQDLLAKYPDQKIGFVTHSKVQQLLNAYDTTGGEYVDHDHFLNGAESPGKEKTMQLAMNLNEPPVPTEGEIKDMRYGIPAAGAGKAFVMTRKINPDVMPAANENKHPITQKVIQQMENDIVQQRLNEFRDKLLSPKTRDIPEDVMKASKDLGHLGFDRAGQALQAIREDVSRGIDPHKNWDITNDIDKAKFKKMVDFAKTPFPEKDEQPRTLADWERTNPDLVKYVKARMKQDENRSRPKPTLATDNPNPQQYPSSTDQLRDWFKPE
ncbi:MAG: histidine phosphatase family protein [Thaumarchaeota archaeon]|nr:histidine phosphatase family protein [Nitrososphaerota archaeon]